MRFSEKQKHCCWVLLVSVLSVLLSLALKCEAAKLNSGFTVSANSAFVSVSNSSSEEFENLRLNNNSNKSSIENLNETENYRSSKLLVTQIDETDEDLIESVDEILLDSTETLKGRAIQNLMKVFGISSNISAEERDDKCSKLGPAPQFMLDLYNTVTDAYGVTRTRNPYNAHIVRSYLEKDNSLNDFFFFNVTSGITESETVLEAELHLHRMPMRHDSLHPSLYLTPFYILSLYQVQDPNQLHIPDLHKLLGVNYVPALGSGWEVFNVKQAVLEWIKGDRPNHGFLIAATSLSGERVPVRFSRRGETIHHSKQPILVLFTEDSDIQHLFPTKPPPVAAAVKKVKKHENISSIDPVEDQLDNEQLIEIPMSSLENPRFHHALLYKDSIRHPNSVNRFRNRRSKNITDTTTMSTTTAEAVTSQPNNTVSYDSSGERNIISSKYTECGRHDLFVSFESIGWSSWIISPKGYNAFFCDGPCKFPLGQQVKPTNHATVQSIVYELKLSTGVQRPCCVPTSLLPISLLFYDDQDNVVLKQYVDMVAESCGCH